MSAAFGACVTFESDMFCQSAATDGSGLLEDLGWDIDGIYTDGSHNKVSISLY